MNAAGELTDELAYALASWSFNVMLECSGREDDKLEMAIGGAILDLRDLDLVLDWACRQADKECTGATPNA